MFQAKNINKNDFHWLYIVVSDGFCVVYTLRKDRSSREPLLLFSTTFFFHDKNRGNEKQKAIRNYFKELD